MVFGLFHGPFSDVLFVHSTRQTSYIRMQHGQSQSTNPLASDWTDWIKLLKTSQQSAP